MRERKSLRIPTKKITVGEDVRERLGTFNRTEYHAVLATESEGMPYTSLVAYALTSDCKGIVFATPKATRKYNNILKNKKVSLLLDTRSNTSKDYMNAEAITVMGNARAIRHGSKRQELAKLFIKKHPKLSGFIQSSETAIVFVEIASCFHVSRFQAVSEWHIKESS